MDATLQGLLGGWLWRRPVCLAMLSLCVLCQADLVPALAVSLGRGSVDRAAMCVFFFCGFSCLDYALWVRRVSSLQHRAWQRRDQSDY